MDFLSEIELSYLDLLNIINDTPLLACTFQRYISSSRSQFGPSNHLCKPFTATGRRVSLHGLANDTVTLSH